MLINLILIFAQMLIMGIFGDFHLFPLLNILVPIFALVNLIFYLLDFHFKWPFILFISSLFLDILIGYFFINFQVTKFLHLMDLK